MAALFGRSGCVGVGEGQVPGGILTAPVGLSPLAVGTCYYRIVYE